MIQSLWSNVLTRVVRHQPFSCDYRPWSIAVVIEFSTEREAVRFERYLKSGSGRAFAKRHFAPYV